MDTSASGGDRAADDIAPRYLAVISAGTNEPSTTRMLADRITQQSLEDLREMGTTP